MSSRSGMTCTAIGLFAALTTGMSLMSAPLPATGGRPDEKGLDLPALAPEFVAEFPRDPDFEEKQIEDDDRPFFNDFSWRAFISLNWPADPDQRGIPHPTKKFGDISGPVVWGTWKSVDELFPANPSRRRPTEWGSYDASLAVRWLDPDEKQKRFDLEEAVPYHDAGKVKLLGEVSRLARLADFHQASGDPRNPKGPLVARNGTFVRYEVRVNRMSYDFIRNNKYYIGDNLPKPGVNGPVSEFPEGSVHVKAAWMELPDDEGVRRRFYHVRAKVVDWKADGTPILLDRTMGLVGLHIVAKTPLRRDWIWSTFEHVDNLPPAPSGLPSSFGSDDPSARENKAPEGTFQVGKPLPKAAPVNVQRKGSIHRTTEEINRRYQEHPQVKGTVWANYKLVGTQWPRGGRGTRFDGASRLPQDLANVAMETYAQNRSCLACHAASTHTGFVFYPQVRAFNSERPGGGGD